MRTNPVQGYALGAVDEANTPKDSWELLQDLTTTEESALLFLLKQPRT